MHTADQQYICSCAKQVPPVTLVHCHTTNSTCHASYSIHQVIDIINHVKLSATQAHLLNRTIPSFTHPEKVTVIFPPRRALLSLHSLTAILAPASSALATLCLACRISCLASYSLLCLLSHLDAEYLASGSCASDEGHELSVIPTNGVAEGWGSCRVLEPVASTGRTTQVQWYRPGLVILGQSC